MPDPPIKKTRPGRLRLPGRADYRQCFVFLGRAIFLLATLAPCLAFAVDSYASLKDFQEHQVIGESIYVACAIYPSRSDWCDIASSAAPSPNQLALVSISKHLPDGDLQSQIFLFHEHGGRYEIHDRSPVLAYAETAQAFGLTDLSFGSRSKFTARFCEGMLYYCEHYTFAYKGTSWLLTTIGTESMGSTTDQKSGESFIDQTAQYSVDVATGKSVSQKYDEFGKPLKSVHKKIKPGRVTFATFSLGTE